MDETVAAQATSDTDTEAEASTDAGLLDEELLVEEISIDGMCGVY